MLAYSGIIVTLGHKGMAYYYASDKREFTRDAAMGKASKTSPRVPVMILGDSPAEYWTTRRKLRKKERS